MKTSKLLFETLRDAPNDCIIASQKLMTRGGYMKYMHNGIYSLYASTKRMTKKIENIIREEMRACFAEANFAPQPTTNAPLLTAEQQAEAEQDIMDDLKMFD